ncbi:MAG TPA: hypothetical protein PLH43_06920 [Acetivibrio sp.]|nr:hypothetical protein [Acetivibrio sp.]HOM02542.1 hypothetical protein [Acetivibrio sp.]
MKFDKNQAFLSEKCEKKFRQKNPERLEKGGIRLRGLLKWYFQ